MPCLLHTSQTKVVQTANYSCVTTDKSRAKCSSSSFTSIHMVHPSTANHPATGEILHSDTSASHQLQNPSKFNKIWNFSGLTHFHCVWFPIQATWESNRKGECSYKIGMAKEEKKVCYCSYSVAKMNLLLTHLKSFHFYATVYSGTQPGTYRHYLLSMKYFYNETLIFWISSCAGKKYVWC